MKGEDNKLNNIEGGVMVKFLIIFLFIIFHSQNLLALDSLLQDGFYVGIDASKNDDKIGKIDKSVSQEKVEEDRYYGYKLQGSGFFVAPEVSADKNKSTSSRSFYGTNQGDTLNQTSLSKTNSNYNLKANIGYDFSKSFSGFLTYDIVKFSYNSNLGVSSLAVNRAAGNTAIGIGSQINFSNSFGVKVLYGQQQFENNTASGGQIRSDIIKVGTVYSF